MKLIRITGRPKGIRLNFISRKITMLKAKKLRHKHERLLKKTRSFLLIPTAFAGLAIYSMMSLDLYLLAAMTTFGFVASAALYVVKVFNEKTHKIRKEEIPKLLR